MSDQATKSLAFAIADWLHSKDAASADAGKRELASSLISEAFGVDTANAVQRATYAKGSPGLSAIFDVFLKAQKKMAPADAKPASEEPKGVSEADQAKAEELKNEGNKYMSAKDYGAALNSYTKAIELNGASPVFYSNRAAAYSQIGQHDEAIADAKKASEIDPKFGKAYSRLGHALFASGRYEEALAAYEKGYEVDPSNKLMKSGMDASRAKVTESKRDGAVTSSTPRAGEGAGGAGAGPGAGGMPDLGALLNNPMLASMAQQMMQNGGLEQLMNNPMLRQMADQYGSGGGMPDINAMMNNPQLRQYVARLTTGWRSSSCRTWAALAARDRRRFSHVSRGTLPRCPGRGTGCGASHLTPCCEDDEHERYASCVREQKCAGQRLTHVQC